MGILHFLKQASYQDNIHGILVTDAKGNILSHNKAFAKQAGHLISKNIFQRFPDSEFSLRTAYSKVVQGKPFVIQALNLIAPQSPSTIQVFKYRGLIVITIEDLLKGSDRLLLHETWGWTQHLQIMLQGISHELRTPLATAKGYSELLEEDPFAIRLRDSLDRMSSILQNMSSTFQEGNGESNFYEDLSTYTRSMNYGEPQKKYVGTYDLDIEESKDKIVYTSKTRVHQILNNLFDNAIRAVAHKGEEGNISLHVCTCTESFHNKCVTLTFSDNGQGMDSEVKSNIFTPYFSTREQGTGRGLGGYIIYHFVREAGGHISVDSTQGVGTTFVIHFPYE